MSLVPGWDAHNDNSEFVRSPPKSASSSLNAAILAKKEATEKALKEKAARLEVQASLDKPAEESRAGGWWSTVDTGSLNVVEEPPAKPSTFSSQFSVTGQSGIGSSLFGIKRNGSEAPAETAVPAEPVVAAPAAAPPAAVSGDKNPGQAPEGDAKGWWGKMDAGTLNHVDDSVHDLKAPQAFTPQLATNSGLTNRLVPLTASSAVQQQQQASD